MKVSVVIPTFNSAKVIRKTLDSVLRQTCPAEEILVLDDGSQDETVSVLESYKPRITVLQQANRGVAAARNVLCEKAGGNFIAFLDHDDLWHPRYLEVQRGQFEKHPQAAAFFVCHENFNGFGDFDWSKLDLNFMTAPEVIGPVRFVERYNKSTGTFYSMSFCCIPKSTLAKVDGPPFCEEVSGVDDCYLCNLLPLQGPVVFTPIRLVAYRLTSSAQSVNQLKNFKQVVDVFEKLEARYVRSGDARLLGAFNAAFAGKRRRYGKTLMGAGRVAEARSEFRKAARRSPAVDSRVKSLGLYFASLLPKFFQPRWPASQRQPVSAS